MENSKLTGYNRRLTDGKPTRTINAVHNNVRRLWKAATLSSAVKAVEYARERNLSALIDMQLTT